MTERLRLTLVKESDLADIHELHALPETDKYNTLGIPKDIEQTRKILTGWIRQCEAGQYPEYTYVIREKLTGSFIGLIALKCGKPKFRIGEVWYKLHVNHWQKGFATEALSRLLAFGFNELKLHRIEAGCAVGNTGSIKVLEKVGMLREGQKRKVLPLKEGWSDNFEYAMLEDDWIRAAGGSNK